MRTTASKECQLPLRGQVYTEINYLYHPACRCSAASSKQWLSPLVCKRNDPLPWKRGTPETGKCVMREVLVLRCRSVVEVDQWKNSIAQRHPMASLPRVARSKQVPPQKHRACLVSQTSFNAMRDIDDGLLHAQTFWLKFSKNVEDLRRPCKLANQRKKIWPFLSFLTAVLNESIASVFSGRGRERSFIGLSAKPMNG